MKIQLIKKIYNHFIVSTVVLSLNLNGMNHAAPIPFSIAWGRVAAATMITCGTFRLIYSTCLDIAIDASPILQPNPQINHPDAQNLHSKIAIARRLKDLGYSEKTIAQDKPSVHYFYRSWRGTHNLFRIGVLPNGMPHWITVSQMAWNELKKGNFPGAIARILIMGIPFFNTSTLFTVKGNLKFPWQPNSIQ